MHVVLQARRFVMFVGEGGSVCSVFRDMGEL